MARVWVHGPSTRLLWGQGGDGAEAARYIEVWVRRVELPVPSGAGDLEALVMFVFRVLGGWAILLSIISVVHDATQSYQSGAPFAFASLGKTVYGVSHSALANLQAGIERYVHPMLWDPFALTILKTPAFAVFAVVGVVLYGIGLRRRGTNIFAN
jgi:hypothetical protein